MGSAKRHRRQFLEAHPICTFCGAKATTIEHCPPRAMFQHNQWPEGFEFPSCEACNHDTSDDDLLIAVLARMDPLEEKGNIDGKLSGLIMMANRQFPGILKKMMPSANEARRYNRQLGIQPSFGQTHQEVGSLKITKELDQAVATIAKKLAKGIFYNETKRPFPNNGCLISNWFSNVELLKNGTYKMFDLLKELGGKTPPLVRTKKYLNNQFEYKLTMSPEHDLLVLQARFGNAFGFVVFGCTSPGILESMINRITEETRQNGPFAILQSPILKP